MRRPRRGFTLIELLVVIAIIGVLVGLLLPAVQAAREAARRAQCTNNLKQLGLALHNYHDSHGSLPPGRIAAAGCPRDFFTGCQNTTWFVMMLPEFEQRPLFDSFNFALGSEGPLAPLPLGFFANATVGFGTLALFQCPSDTPSPFQVDPNYLGGALSGPTFSKGNYGASWGNTYWGQDIPNPATVPLTDPGSGQPARFLPSAFGHVGGVTFASARDGLSQTVFVSEVRQGAKTDQRGLAWSSVIGGGSFSSRFAPNQFKDYYGVENGSDRLNEAVFCVDDPVRGLPCTAASSHQRAFAGSRSQHPGGVNAGMGDGSVRFIKDGISPALWIALNSLRGGEVVGGDQY